MNHHCHNLADRSSQPVLDECGAQGIAFVAFCPPGGSRHQHDAIRTNSVVVGSAAGHGATQ